MNESGGFRFAIAAILALGVMSILYFWPEELDQEHLLASYSYQGPTQSSPRNAQLVRIEVIIRDSPEAGGGQIQSVEFNKQNIPLQQRDIYGNRGTGSFQVLPGKYKLKWVVQRDAHIWPRNIEHIEEVTIDPRDLWLQIEIVGNEASIR